jgi:uncharacterized protein (DUF4415 family)
MKKKPKNISQKDWNEAEIPELTTSEMSKLRPAKEVLPEVVAAYNSGTLKRKQGQRGSQKSPTKQAVSIRLSNTDSINPLAIEVMFIISQ